MQLTEEQMNRAIALGKWPLTQNHMLALADKLEAGEIEVTFDEFGNGQVPVLMPDAESQSFKPQMRRFDINQLIKDEQAAADEVEKAKASFDLAHKKRRACNLFIAALRAAKENALPKTID